ncbi:unnamed protein product [Ectocarpus sp. CCAP 1310/34]|nr:unnamed protein product [Ectocarpus sp. CCAP 1310/34]
MAWSALKLAQEQRRSAIKNAQALVERAHREYVAASVPPAVAAAVAELEKQRREGSTEPPPPAYEAFLEGLSEDYPPLSKSILEAFEASRLSREVSSNIVEVWEGTREALTSLAVDTALSSSLERRVTALEGVRASDQDICQGGACLVK